MTGNTEITSLLWNNERDIKSRVVSFSTYIAPLLDLDVQNRKQFLKFCPVTFHMDYPVAFCGVAS